MLSTYLVFIIGYVARPAGGILFGFFGDKLGRKSSFSVSIFCMAIGTLGICCLPTYNSIGWYATALLVSFRIVQGLSIGGESSGASIFLFESVTEKQIGKVLGFLFMFFTFGNVLANIIGVIISSILDEKQLTSWGWRLPFALGFVLCAISFVIRKSFCESLSYSKLIQEGSRIRNPLKMVFLNNKLKIFFSIILSALPATVVFCLIFISNYVNLISNSPLNRYILSAVSFVMLGVFTYVSGFISDYIQPIKLYLIGCVLMLLTSISVFLLFNVSIKDLILLSCLLAIFGAIINGCYVRIMLSLFKTEVRYTGIGLGFNIGFAIFGGVASYFIGWFLLKEHNILVLSYLLAIIATVSFITGIMIFRNICIENNQNC